MTIHVYSQRYPSSLSRIFPKHSSCVKVPASLKSPNTNSHLCPESCGRRHTQRSRNLQRRNTWVCPHNPRTRTALTPQHRMPPSQYTATILKSTTWGGAIELGILASHYSTEIASIDVETGRIDHFTPSPEAAGGMCCLVIYSGIHYDAATLAPVADAPGEWHETVFSIVRPTDEIISVDLILHFVCRRNRQTMTRTRSWWLERSWQPSYVQRRHTRTRTHSTSSARCVTVLVSLPLRFSCHLTTEPPRRIAARD